MTFSCFQTLSNWLLQPFQLKPGKPAIASSLRALVSVLVPLGIGVWMGHAAESTIAILAAWFVGLVNVDGVYRQKATAKVVAAISITAMLLLANLVHSPLWLSALTTFLVMFVSGFVGVFGQGVSSISLIVAITFVVALAKFAAFPDWSSVLQQCALCLAGGLWSTALSLGLWKLRPYAPVTQAVANCYSSLNQLVDSVKGRVTNLDDRRAQLTRFLQSQDNFTQALTAARARWSATWSAQRAASLSGNQLLNLIEDTPLIANSVVALVEQVRLSSDMPLFQQLQPEIERVMEQIAAALQQIAAAISTGKSSVHLGDLDRVVEALNHQQQTLCTQLRSRTSAIQPHDYTALTSLEKIASTLARLANQVHTDTELIAILQRADASNTAQPASRTTYRSDSAPQQSVSSMLEPLRHNLTVHSVLFRHALRLAIVATLAEVIASRLQIPTGYWITLTAVVALKPNYGGTSQTTSERVLGTVFGGIIGIAIVTLIHNTWIIGGCLLLLIMLAVAVRPLSFSLFAMLLTPAIILLLNVTSHSGWQIGITRIADSLAGGLLALLGSYLLFPRWERQQLPAQLELTLRANLAYFQQVIATYFQPSNGASAEAIAPLRRQAALENTNTAAAAQRLFSEPRHIQGNVEPITTLIFYIRRFFNSVTALAEYRQELSDEYQEPDFKQFADTIVQVLENAANALQQRHPLQPLPDLDRHLDAIHTHLEQFQVTHAAHATALNTSNATLQTVRERALISASLEQLAQEIQSIHSAIIRLQP